MRTQEVRGGALGTTQGGWRGWRKSDCTGQTRGMGARQDQLGPLVSLVANTPQGYQRQHTGFKGTGWELIRAPPLIQASRVQREASSGHPRSL